MKIKRIVKVGLGVGLASTVVGVVVYNVAQAKKTTHYTDKIRNRVGDTINDVACSIKK